MKIRSKIIILTISSITALVIILLLSYWSTNRSTDYNQIIEEGNNLTTEANNVYGLIKDLVFAGFAPDMYRFVKGYVYMPNFNTIYNNWIRKLEQFKFNFYKFMELDELKRLLRNNELEDEYNIILTLSANAFLKIDSLKEKFSKIDVLELLKLGDYSYIEFMIYENNYLNEFFGEIQSTSIYLSTNLDGYLKPFILSLKREIHQVQSNIFTSFWITTGLIALIMIIIVIMILRQLSTQINMVNNYFKIVSKGDFSSQLMINTKDEFGKLSDNLNKFIVELKSRIDVFLKLMSDMNGVVYTNTDMSSIFSLIVQSAIGNTMADCAAILLYDDLNNTLQVEHVKGIIPYPILRKSIVRKSGNLKKGQIIEIQGTIFEEVTKNKKPFFIRGGKHLIDITDEVSSIIINPLMISKRILGVLFVACIEKEHALVDLDYIQIATFADYASLIIDNYMKYIELIGKKEAEYQALQSQIQPHFLFNVLNGFVGLNRTGDKKALEKSILALRRMLRYTLEHSEWTTIKDEFKFLQEYCNLQLMRFDERLDISICFDNEISDFPIPKLIVQPLVENAIIHGLEPLDKKGILRVNAKFEKKNGDNFLKILVEDNGVGFEQKLLAGKKHVGLSNVEERLKIAYKAAVFNIESKKGKGTKSIILINNNEE